MSLQKYCHYMNVLKISIHAHLHMLRCHCRHHHAAMEGGGQHRARVFFTANCPEMCDAFMVQACGQNCILWWIYLII